jgi:hypothetical protein
MRDHRPFHSLRLSLLGALGLSALACASPMRSDSSSESGGSGGDGGDGGASSSGDGGATSASSAASGNTSSASSTGVGGSGGQGCVGGQPVMLPNGKDSGYIRCADGTIHRAHKVACDTAIVAPACTSDVTQKSCDTDADCKAHPNGKCSKFFGEVPGGAYCDCIYSCSEDSDCENGNVCVCNGVVKSGLSYSACAESSACHTDAECPSGECGITAFNDGCFPHVELACRADKDACRVDADCAPGHSCATVYASGTFTCNAPNCAIGRPLLVDGEARMAPSCARGDWTSDAHMPDVSALAPEVRAALADHWGSIAALEHASIASFARFTLELLSIGAPPDLLMLAQRAAADEIEHARIAYALASHYAGAPTGPSRLSLGGVPIATDRREILESLIEEACVGETLGASEALSIASLIDDPALRRVYERIAEDEQRHAELAWKTLRFLLASADGATLKLAADAFERAIEGASRDPRPRRYKAERRQGLLSAEELGALRRQALREVVRPCADALLAHAESAVPTA